MDRVLGSCLGLNWSSFYRELVGRKRLDSTHPPSDCVRLRGQTFVDRIGADRFEPRFRQSNHGIERAHHMHRVGQRGCGRLPWILRAHECHDGDLLAGDTTELDMTFGARASVSRAAVVDDERARTEVITSMLASRPQEAQGPKSLARDLQDHGSFSGGTRW